MYTIKVPACNIVIKDKTRTEQGKKSKSIKRAKSIKQSLAGITGDLFSSVVWLVNNYVSHLLCANHNMTNNKTNFAAALIVFPSSLGTVFIFYSFVRAWKLSLSYCYYPLLVCEMPEELQWVGTIDSLIWSHANCQRIESAEGVKTKRRWNYKSLKNTFICVCCFCHKQTHAH